MIPSDAARIVGRHLLGAPAPHAPVVIRQVGARLHAADGSLWLDAATGGFGAGHPVVNARIAAQARRVALSSRVFVSRPLAEAVVAVHELCPDPLTISYLCNSGAEAMDAAVKLAKGMHPRRRKVLGLLGADHGGFSHGQSLTWGFSVLPDPPLHPAGARHPTALPDRVGPDVAAVVLAPAAPGRALDELSPAWWQRLRAACDEFGTLLVLDERLTGPARVGADLAATTLPVVPDVVVLGETLGADAVPVGCMVTSRACYDRVYGYRNPTVQGSTFGANPLSAAAVSAVLSAVRGEGLAQRQQEVAATAHRLLGKLAGPHRPIQAVTADGSLIGIRTATPAVAQTLAAALADERVLVRPPSGAVVAILPPLIAAPVDVEDLLTRTACAAQRLDADLEAIS